ncbi:MAG: hypothetical protein GXP06_12470 [Alphaproteobacteria bacterium]|nr:hypothetical protein [Alphaproteobacteria bacterium]
MEKDQTQFVEEIRANVAFEHLVAAIVSGAALAAAIFFVLDFAALVFAGALSAPNFLALILKSFTLCIMVFLIGFLAGALIVTRMFKALEKAKRRSVWPYLAASIGVTGFSLIMLFSLQNAGAPEMALIIAVIAAGLFIAFDFGRRMSPLWRAVERAEEQAVGTVRRLH